MIVMPRDGWSETKKCPMAEKGCIIVRGKEYRKFDVVKEVMPRTCAEGIAPSAARASFA